jgi:hypothetical protein
MAVTTSALIKGRFAIPNQLFCVTFLDLLNPIAAIVPIITEITVETTATNNDVIIDLINGELLKNFRYQSKLKLTQEAVVSPLLNENPIITKIGIYIKAITIAK